MAGRVKEIPPPLPELQNSFFVPRKIEERVSFGRKLVFWLLLGILSVIFAEVTCASSPYPFFDGWGLLVVTPLYTLHTLFLAGLLYNRKQVSLSSLMLAGILFGLYEALITKVIWNPTWGDTASMLGGVAWLQTSVLVFYWHPWFAFIFPLLFGEALFTSSNEIRAALPAKFNGPKRLVWAILLAVLSGANQGANGAAFENILLSTAESLAVFLMLAGLWHWISRGREHAMRDLLPRGQELIWVGVLLFILYGLSLVFIRPEALPRAVLPYVIVSALYLVTIVALALSLNKAPDVLPYTLIDTQHHFWRDVLVFALVFLASSLLFLQITKAAEIVIILSWGFGVIMGVVLFLRAIWMAVKK